MKTTEKIYYFIFVNVIFLSLLSCEAPQEDNSQISEGISKTNEAFMAALANGDAAGVVSLYTEDGQILPPNTDLISGSQNIQNFFQGFIDSGLSVISLVSTEVEGMGDTAIEVGKYTISVDDQVVDSGKYIVIWKKDGEEWKLHRDIFNSNMALAVDDEDEDEDEDEDDDEDDDDD